MTLMSLGPIESAITGSWRLDTCDPVDVSDWSAANPARGQCGATSLVLQDLLGGEILVAEVRHADGTRQGVHYWNRLSGGLEVDLTRSQFTRGERIGEPEPAVRPANSDGGRLAEQYAVLADRVARRLHLPAGTQTP